MNQRDQWSDSALSALFDEAAGSADRVANQSANRFDDAALERWVTYQVIQDGLRHGAASSGDAFIQKFRSRLKELPVEPMNVMQPSAFSEAANDVVMRWKWVAGLSSCVAAGLLAWVSWGSVESRPNLAQTSPASQMFSFATPYPPVSAHAVGFSQTAMDDDVESSGAMLRDPALDELLRAHGVISPAHAVSFFRNASSSHEGL